MVWGTQAPQRVQAEPGRQTVSGAVWAENRACGDSYLDEFLGEHMQKIWRIPSMVEWVKRWASVRAKTWRRKLVATCSVVRIQPVPTWLILWVAPPLFLAPAQEGGVKRVSNIDEFATALVRYKPR